MVFCGSFVFLSFSSHAFLFADEKSERRFGEAQLKQLFADRPDVKPLFDQFPELAEWVIAMFSGKGKERIYWDDAPPPYSCSTCSVIGHEIAAIRVSGDEKISPLDRLTYVVFELNNAVQPHVELVKSMSELPKDKFAELGGRLEHQALLECKRRLANIPITAIASPNDSFTNFVMIAPEDFQEFIGCYCNSEGRLQSPNPLSYWLELYDIYKDPNSPKK